MKRGTAAAGLLLAILSGPTGATQVSVRTVPCPLGGAPVKVYEKLSANTHGGFDSDLAGYSTEGQFREWAISTCPDSLFSLYGADMGLPLDEATRRRLAAALAEEVGRLAAPDHPEVWERYGLAARMYRELGRDPLWIARVYLEGSWTARDRAVGVYEGLEGPAVARQLLAQGDIELQKPLTAAQRRTVAYNLARVAHRLGDGKSRDAYLSTFEKAGPLNEKERAALDRFRLVAREIEPRFQDLAIGALQEGLRRDGVAMDEKVRSTYILADLLRRRGRPRDALPLYTLVLAEEAAPQELREMALGFAREIAGDGAPLPAAPR